MKPASVEDLKAIIRGAERLFPRGARSKSGLSGLAIGLEPLDISGLSGIVEYDPGEYTFTALAGTRVKDVEMSLAEHGQYLPFDPVLSEAGATLGGVVATGLSGPGRYRYGGVRDFLLGVKFLNGEGELVAGGGRVVKNAAGFDLPKLMVGSLGQFGALVELSFKVFPVPEAFGTLSGQYQALEDGFEAVLRVASAPLDLVALDLVPGKDSVALFVRVGGKKNSLAARIHRIQNILQRGASVPEDEEAGLWRAAREFEWLPANCLLVKVPVTPKQIPDLDKCLQEHLALRRYSAGANVAWVAWPGKAADFDRILLSLGLSGLVVIGTAGKPLLGKRTGQEFARRIKRALDPGGKWVEV
ncbi:MAG TPA: FAD-binding protein [Anaerolineales bacterium]